MTRSFLTDGRKLRLLGINTPEIGDNLKCYGDEATALLRSLLPVGTHVWVQADIEPLDQCGRSLPFIYTDDIETDDATNINLELLNQGPPRRRGTSPTCCCRPRSRLPRTRRVRRMSVYGGAC